jgi:hypothetical protein
MNNQGWRIAQTRAVRREKSETSMPEPGRAVHIRMDVAILKNPSKE